MSFRDLMLAVLYLWASRAQAQTSAPGDWRFSSDLRRAVTLPREFQLSTLGSEYEYPSRLVGLTIDLNHDGRPDFILRPAVDACGASGNCSFALVDGATVRKIGTIEGNTVFVRAKRIGGWPILQTWWHSSAGSGLFTTYVFDGKAYAVVSAVHVQGYDLQSLFADLDKIREGPPTR